MFTVTSRYQSLPTATYVLPDGRTVRYALRRFLPQPEYLAEIGEHVVQGGELHRLDLIAAREIGNPEMFWQIADANRAMDPDDLAAVAGRRLRLTLPAGIPLAGGLPGASHG